MNTINLDVPQGVGDIFWVYQKFSPYFDKINFNICQLAHHDPVISQRSLKWVKLFPKTGEVLYKNIPEQEYCDLIGGIFQQKDILKTARPDISFKYSCNKHLENGVRIEKIDEELLIEKTVELQINSAPLKFKEGSYICVYVSGGEKAWHRNQINGWGYSNWISFIKKIYNKYNFNFPIIFVGASYDREAIESVQKALIDYKIECCFYCDSYPANVLYIIKNSKLFVGYQSGLSILADNMDVKQIMMYFPVIKNMMYAWPKKENIDNKIYNCATFDQTPNEVVANLPDKIL